MSLIPSATSIDGSRVIRDLRSLDSRSGGRRLAWTQTWRDERQWLIGELRRLKGVEVDLDEAGNLWALLPGETQETVVVGSHLDCVPGGGWLDGALGVLTGVQLMREIAESPRPTRSLALVDWADEEGARFGCSLFGSSAAAGLLSVEAVEDLTDEAGNTLRQTLLENGVELQRALDSRSRLANVGAYLELHIEQGRVLEELDRRCAAVRGAFGIRRRRLRFTGTATHASAPLAARQDATLVGAQVAVTANDAAARRGGRATVRMHEPGPQAATIVSSNCEITVDLRHEHREALEALDAELVAAARTFASGSGCEMSNELLMDSPPVAFDPALVDLLVTASGGAETLASAAQHDAVSVAKAGIPTAMLFVRSLGGISHSRDESSNDDDLIAAANAFASVVRDRLSDGAE
jgi:hydantoinase/carbamoylase family amidase